MTAESANEEMVTFEVTISAPVQVPKRLLPQNFEEDGLPKRLRSWPDDLLLAIENATPVNDMDDWSLDEVRYGDDSSTT